MKYAVIADIHGNYPALKLVIEDALAQGAEGFLILGDYCVSAPWPREVLETIAGLTDAYIVRGNEEDYLQVPEGDDGQFEISRWCKHALSAEQIDWACNLPRQVDFRCEGVDIHMAHSAEPFVGQAKCGNFSTFDVVLRYPKGRVAHEDLLRDVRCELEKDCDFQSSLQTLPRGVYLFGHTHVQWHLRTEKHLFINPGSCGLALDGEEFGAPYTLLTVENGEAAVEERRIKYDVHELIEQVKTTTQYKEAHIWSEVIFREWLSGREKVGFFLRFAEEYARSIGDTRRPFAKDTWCAAYEAWKDTV